MASQVVVQSTISDQGNTFQHFKSQDRNVLSRRSKTNKFQVLQLVSWFFIEINPHNTYQLDPVGPHSKMKLYQTYRIYSTIPASK